MPRQQPRTTFDPLLPRLPTPLSPRSKSPLDSSTASPATPTHYSYFSGLDTGYEPWNKRVIASRSPKVIPPALPRSRSPPRSIQSSSESTSSAPPSLDPPSDTPAESSTRVEHISRIMSGALKRKVVIMGSPSVGKTSLTQQWIAPPTYNESYFPTIEATSHKIINFEGVEYECEVIDSAGQDEYTLFPPKYAVGVHGYLLVYSINSRQSFEMIQTVHDKILDFAGLEKVPCVVVGQKSDLASNERRVTTAEGEAAAKKLHAAFIESSAKDNKNVGKAFEVLLREMQKEYNPAPEKKKSSWWGWGS